MSWVGRAIWGCCICKERRAIMQCRDLLQVSRDLFCSSKGHGIDKLWHCCAVVKVQVQE